VSAAGIAPDLRTSPFILSDEGFDQVVRRGALVPQGMPDFPEFSDTQLADLRQYLRDKTAQWRAEGVK
jgi:quinohemoprotein ethanol dehydrogenase